MARAARLRAELLRNGSPLAAVAPAGGISAAAARRVGRPKLAIIAETGLLMIR